MSWCRKSKDCDLYVYDHVDGYVVCQECKLGGSVQFDSVTMPGRQFFDYTELKKHLEEHKAAGHQFSEHLLSLCDELIKAGKPPAESGVAMFDGMPMLIND